MESFNVLYRTLAGQTLLPVCSEALGSNYRTGKNAWPTNQKRPGENLLTFSD